MIFTIFPICWMFLLDKVKKRIFHQQFYWLMTQQKYVFILNMVWLCKMEISVSSFFKRIIRTYFETKLAAKSLAKSEIFVNFRKNNFISRIIESVTYELSTLIKAINKSASIDYTFFYKRTSKISFRRNVLIFWSFPVS